MTPVVKDGSNYRDSVKILRLNFDTFLRVFFFFGLRTGVLLGVIYDTHRVRTKPETNLGRFGGQP